MILAVIGRYFDKAFKRTSQEVGEGIWSNIIWRNHVWNQKILRYMFSMMELRETIKPGGIGGKDLERNLKKLERN